MERAVPTGATSPLIDPERVDAVLFDLDGVITDTASVHEAAWARLFDDVLGRLPEGTDEEHGPFSHADYQHHVDGKPRVEGIIAFLAARGIVLPLGEPSDTIDDLTVHGLGNDKNAYFLDQLREHGVAVFDSTVELVRSLHRHGIATAVFSASRNCQAVLERAGVSDLFAVRVDGVVAAELGLAGKPDPATLLEAARRLGVDPGRAVVVEDALAGVEAGRRGGFGLVIGVDRSGQADALRDHGADVVVGDLAEVRIAEPRRRLLSQVPGADAAATTVRGALVGGPTAVFLDFDGTLSPIVDDPDAAQPVPGARRAIERLARVCRVAVVSGRDLPDVRRRVDIPDIWYAGSHGYEMAGPDGEHHEYEPARRALPALDAAERALRERIRDVPGAIVERKRFSLSAHYRKVDPERVDEVLTAVQDLGAHHEELHVTHGRRVVELAPDLPWDKGRAVDHLLTLMATPEGTTPVYAGDDLTDEDALEAVHDRGLGIVVRNDEHGDRPTAAHVAVEGPDELCELLERMADVLGPTR